MLKEEACLCPRSMGTDGLLLQDDDATKAVPQQGSAGGAHLDDLGALFLPRQRDQGSQVCTRDRLQGAAGAVPVEIFYCAASLLSQVAMLTPACCPLSSHGV